MEVAPKFGSGAEARGSFTDVLYDHARIAAVPV